MSCNIRSLFLVVFVVGLLTGCAAPAPTTILTIEVPTSTPTMPGVQISIPVGEANETLHATITGNGDVGIIMANTSEVPALRWAPLVDALDSNENLRIVTFDYRDVNSTGKKIEDVAAVLDYLRGEGIQKTICIGSGDGSLYCANLREEPETIGMVFIATWVSAIDSEFPKLFLTADADPLALAGSTQRAYEQSAEPKEFKSYASGRHGPGLFTDPNVGPQALADVVDFINGIVADK